MQQEDYIISLDKIQSIVNRKIRLISAELPLSSSYVSAISDWVKK